MRHLRQLTASAALALTAAVALAGGEIVWLNPDHDFGAFDEELGTVTCSFRGVNTGDAPIAITSARANCGCTTPHYTTSPVAPGDTLTLLVGYNATGRPGKFSKKVSVTTDGKPMRSTLTISGTVIGTSNTLRGRYPIDAGSMRLRDTRFPFGEVTNISVATSNIEGVNTTRDTIRPVIAGAPRHISARVSPQAVAPGETFVVSAIFDGALCNDWDIVNDSLRLVNRRDTVTIQSAAIVREAFRQTKPGSPAPAISLTPKAIDLDRITARTGDKPLKTELEIFNTGNAPLRIRKISSADPAVDIRLKNSEIRPGKSVKAQVVINRGALASRKMLNALIVIIANDPVMPRSTVRLTGEIIP